MKTTHFMIESERDAGSNVIPLRPVKSGPRGTNTRPPRSSNVQAHAIEANVLEQELPEQRLARRVERVLSALLYHSAGEPRDLRDSKFFSIEKRVSQLVSRSRLTTIAHAAISMDCTTDLTRLAAVAITFELQTQSRWLNRMLRVFSASRRQINADTLAIARLLAWDLDALKARPIDAFAKFI